MKINFIRQISDDILKQNQELKSTIIQAKQTLNNYQSQMISFLKFVNLQVPILDQPLETLRLFVKHVTAEIQNSSINNHKNKENARMLDQANKKVQYLAQQLKRRKIQEQFREKKWREGKIASENLQRQLKRSITELGNESEQLKREMGLMAQRHKIQGMLFQELKRKQLEQVRLFHHNKTMEARDRLEEQHVMAYKKIKQEMLTLEKKNKDLQKTIFKLVNNIKLEESELQILKQLVISLQEALKASQSLDSLKDQIFELKKQLKALEKESMQKKSEIIQLKVRQQNYLSQIERQQLERHEFEMRLSKKIKEVEKSEKDKQAMELYYDTKWHSQFNKVRTNLDKSFQAKIEQMEKTHKQLQQQFDRKSKANDAAVSKYKQRNSQLQIIFENDKAVKAQLNSIIEKERYRVKEKERQIDNIWKMSREQIIVIVDRFDQKEFKMNQQIVKLHQQIVQKERTYEKITKNFNDEVRRLVTEARADITLQYKDTIFRLQQEKSQAAQAHSEQVRKLTEELDTLLSRLKTVKEDIISQCDKRVDALKQLNELKLKQKQEQLSKKIEKAQLKQKEAQLRLSNQKKQHDDQKHNISRQMLRIERESASIIKIKEQLETQLNQQQIKKVNLSKQISRLQGQITDLQGVIREKAQQVRQQKKKANQAQKQMQLYRSKQLNWERQLRSIQEDYNTEFQQLKQLCHQQKIICKSKIWYLEEKLKVPIMNEKNYKKIKNLQAEKQQLKTLIDQKQAQNIALTQVKDYFEVRFKSSQNKKSQTEIKNKIILNRKMQNHSRKHSYQVVQTNRYMEENKNVKDMKRYITQHNKKQNWLGFSRTKYSQHSAFDRNKTNPC